MKWVGHRDYQRTIPPTAAEEVDIFATRFQEPGLFLLSTLDVIPRQPVVTQNGKYELNYKVFAQDFPMVEFTVTLDLQWQSPPQIVLANQTTAQLKL